MAEVWSLQLPGRVVLTALALADHADHDGRNAYPSVALLAWKTGHDRRTIQRHLRELEALGLIRPIGYAKGGHGRATRYVFDFEAVPAKDAAPGRAAI